jgi:Family of unknown function (DUF6092)
MSPDPAKPVDGITPPEAESLFEIVSYLISAARLSIDEAPRYGSARLLVGAVRLIAAAEALDGVEVDDTLREWKEAMDANLMKVMNFYPEYVQWLGDLTREVAEEVTNRNLAAP